MKKIIVRKILKYDPTLGGQYTKYEGYRLIGLGRLNPSILRDQKLKVRNDINIVFCSNLKRSDDTAKTIGLRSKLVKLKNLSEISFNLGELVTKEEYETFGSNLVRERFIDAFIKDKLLEKRSSIKKRIENLFAKLNEFPNGKYLLISHSFFMKILQVYLKDKSLFENPKVLEKYFDPNKKTFIFGKGFEFNVK